MSQTIQQQRAAFALEVVERAVREIGNNEKEKSEFRAYAHKLPSMIRTNGFGQAMAFVCSKGVLAANAQPDKNKGKRTGLDAYTRIYDALQTWLTGDNQPYSGEKKLMQAITGKDMQHYRLAEAEAMAMADWLKKFARAYIRKS